MAAKGSYVLPFRNIGSADLARVGGKGANLGELTRAGYDVPPGFCVTTAAYARFMAGAERDIYKDLAGLVEGDIEALRKIGKKVRGYLEKLPLPPEVAEDVGGAWRELGEGSAYAVRSSATAEDLPYASFAGQQDTYLNIRGQEELLKSVKACFISLFTDRAILYRVQNGFDHRQVALSVVVQQMVEPEVSGILFTADPVSGHRKIASIDASYGLGEALVAGLVSADLYQVDKESLQIVKKQIGAKQMAIRALPGGGTEQVEISDGERKRAALSEGQILELTELGKAIEAHYGKPQDIEWALADGRIYVTQSRPITSLFPLPEPEPQDDALHVYFSLSHLQVMTDAMPPLALAAVRTLLPVGHPYGVLESTRVPTAGGRLYADLSPLLRHRFLRRPVLRGLSGIDQLAVRGLADLAERQEFRVKGERFHPGGLMKGAIPIFAKILSSLLFKNPEGVSDEVLNRMGAYLVKVKTELNTASNLRAKLDLTVGEMQHAFGFIFGWVPRLASGVLARMLLRRTMSAPLYADELAALDRGLLGNVATDMNLAVGDLADAARGSEELMAHLAQHHQGARARLAGAAELPGGEAFLKAWNRFLDRYGARGPSEIDLSRPRWREDPSSLLQMVVGLLGQEAGAHRAHYRKLTVENEQAATRLVIAARQGWWGWLRGPLVRRLLRVSRKLAPLREHHKFLAIQLLALVKEVLLEAGQRLETEGRLESAADVWMLTLTEVLAAFDDPGKELRALVKERKDELEHYRQLSPPRVMTSEGEVPAVKLDGGQAPEGALIGSPVSAGVVEGVAKVVFDPGNGILEPGEILVAPFTDPGWTPLFVNAAGLITEVGGLMTHGSVVAREYGIPAVVGVQEATRHIKTGQRVRVHGHAGYIELLDSELLDSPGAGQDSSKDSGTAGTKRSATKEIEKGGKKAASA